MNCQACPAARQASSGRSQDPLLKSIILKPWEDDLVEALTEAVPRVYQFDGDQGVSHEEVVDQGRCLDAGVRHQQGRDHTDLVREREEEQETLQEVQQGVEYPVGRPVGQLRSVLLFVPVVPEVEEGLIDRDDQSAKDVYEDQEKRAQELHRPA